MSRFKYTFLAHAVMDHCNPISPAKIEEVMSAMALARGASVVDIGCGKAELLIRLAEKYGARGVGYERSHLMAAEARDRAARRAPGLVDVREQDASGVRLAPASVDAAVCLGASEALGGRAAAVRTLAEWVKPGGLVLIGEGLWEREPAPAYLEATGIGRDEFGSHADNMAFGRASGLNPLWAATASPDDWDRYEWSHALALERHAAAAPDDPDAATMLERSRQWRAAYMTWGRGTLGFGVYLFRRP